jgi:thiol-disulfide isomerase/thioredoxin
MTNGTKALIGMLLAGTAGVLIFLFVHLSGDPDSGPIQVRAPGKAQACTRGEGKCMPDVNYVDVNGTAYTPKSLSGKVVVVNFWATWCKPCQREIPDLSKVYERYKDKGLVILGVMTDDPDHNSLLNFQSDNEMTYPVVRASSDILVSFGYPGALPTTFVYDRGGKEVHAHVGPLRESQLAGMLEPLLAQK